MQEVFVATASSTHEFRDPLRTAKTITGWSIVVAVLFLIAGVFAIAEPALAGLAMTLFVGWMLAFGGIAHLFSAFSGGVKHILWQVLIGVAYIIGGIYFLTHPLLAIGTLTLWLAFIIIWGGALEIIAYFRFRGEEASGWMLFNGIITLVLGGMILAHWPSSSIWAIGTLVGVALLVSGMTRLMVGLAARRFMSDVTAGLRG